MQKIGKNEEDNSESIKTKQITLANIKFSTVLKLCGFILNRKFRSRAPICKNNQLNQSYKTQVMIKRSLNINLNKIRNLKFSKS